MRWYICVVVFSVAVSFLCSVPCHAQEEQEDDAGQHDEEETGTTIPQLSIEAKYRAVEESFKNVINSLIKRALPTIIQFQDKAELTPECMGSFLKIIGKMRNLDRETFRSKSNVVSQKSRSVPPYIGRILEFTSFKARP